MSDIPRVPESPTAAVQRCVREFEGKAGGWRVALPAQVVIQQFFISIFTDHLGLQGLNRDQRRDALTKAVEELPAFLEDLRKKAEPRLDNIAKSAGINIDEAK